MLILTYLELGGIEVSVVTHVADGIHGDCSEPKVCAYSTRRCSTRHASLRPNVSRKKINPTCIVVGEKVAVHIEPVNFKIECSWVAALKCVARKCVTESFNHRISSS